MSALGPRLAMSIPNQVQKDGSKLGVVLKFNDLEDFEPENIVRQVEPLKQLLEARERLADLKTKVVSNDKLEAILQKVIQTTENLRKKLATGSPSVAGSQETSATDEKE
jgi:type VI secretion system protein ImpB